MEFLITNNSQYGNTTYLWRFVVSGGSIWIQYESSSQCEELRPYAGGGRDEIEVAAREWCVSNGRTFVGRVEDL